MVFGSKGFYARGPQVFNNFPLHIRQENVFINFMKKAVDLEHFSNP